jgi:hypothetical protein
MGAGVARSSDMILKGKGIFLGDIDRNSPIPFSFDPGATFPWLAIFIPLQETDKYHNGCAIRE